MKKILDYLKRPVIAAIAGGVVGLILGLIWAYLILPVKWTNVPPSWMGTTYQQDYLRMAVDSYSAHPDNGLAQQRFNYLGAAGPKLLGDIQKDPGNLDPTALSNFANAVTQTNQAPTPPPSGSQPAGKSGTMTSIAIILAAVILFALVAYGILRYLFQRGRITPGREKTTVPAEAPVVARQAEMTEFPAMDQEPPVAKFVTTYETGNDLYDASFSIDAPSDNFLGECGMGISETIGVGDLKKVQAFEVWLFDKNDVKTVTKVLMSAHAYNDPATYQRLQAKGDPFLVEPGKQVVLETATLHMVARVIDAQYGQGAMPDESYFDHLSLEFSVWSKKGQPVA